VPAGEVHDRLELTATRLAALLDEVHAVCVAAQRIAPSEGEDLPGARDGVLKDRFCAIGLPGTQLPSRPRTTS